MFFGTIDKSSSFKKEIYIYKNDCLSVCLFPLFLEGDETVGNEYSRGVNESTSRQSDEAFFFNFDLFKDDV